MIILKDGKPFEGEPNLDPVKVAQIVEAGIWSEKELADRGLFVCAPAVAPDGKALVGDARYVESKTGWVQVFDVEDAPAPIPEPTKADKLDALLNSYGLTLADLKEALK